MNRYQENNFLTTADKQQAVNLNRLYAQARELILRSDNYSFNQVTELLAEQENINQLEAQIFILEKFNRDEGALPGELEEVYLNLKYSPDLWAEKITAGEDFYDLVKEVNNDLRKKGISLNNDLIKERVNELKKELGVS